jgi:steroid delta-isomerase-like uncharacterized protein
VGAEANKRLFVRIVDEILNGGDLDAIDELVAENYVDGFSGSPGREGYRELVRSLRESFPDGRLSVEDLIAEGDKVVGRFTFRGTHAGEFRGIAPTGRPVAFAGIGIVRFENGRMAERWNVSDVQSLLAQLA